MGHAWVDGRHGQADLDALVARLRKTGIRDLFVHCGPLSDDGTLNAALRPGARWLVTSLHRALPGVRVQAWLGDVTGGGHMDLASAATRTAVTRSVRQVLAAVPPDVTLLIGAPAYSTGGPWPFSSAETVARAIRGARLAISPVPPRRPFGIALYVDFTAISQDWASYLTDWMGT
ncbi:MAG TPA: hypothetical protein VFW50_04365 [Streptosporangiaceae bacterium]|nr:hypothetical protein [Streptosporangiaceae bacterium]